MLGEEAHDRIAGGARREVESCDAALVPDVDGDALGREQLEDHRQIALASRVHQRCVSVLVNLVHALRRGRESALQLGEVAALASAGSDTDGSAVCHWPWLASCAA